MAPSRPKRNGNRSKDLSSAESAATTAMDAALASLQPLRDLSRNWDVDIASCLEEYLQELAGIHPQQLEKIAETVVSTDSDSSTGDNDVPNFAHAALLVQNSSNVYSRKVEYLYTLVYKALEDFFRASTTSSSSSKRRTKGVDADIEEFYEYDPNECFLLLDDVVPEDLSPTHKKINLKETDDDDDINFGAPRSSLGGTASTPGSINNRTQSTSKNVTRLSLGGLSVTRMERNNSMFSGGISSQQQQKNLLGILNSGGLRLMSGKCDVADDGLLLMPGSQIGRRSSSNLDDSANTLENSLNGGFPMDDQGDNNGLSNDDELDTGPINLFDDNDDHDEGPGFVMNDDFDGNDNMDEMAVDEIQGGVAALAASQTSSTKRVAFADSVDDQLEKKQQQKQKKKKKDPWQLLDPHSIGDSSYTLKPLKRGKTTRLPEGILQPPSECVTGSSTSFTAEPERRSLAPPVLRPSLAIENFRVTIGKQLEPSTVIPIRGLAYGDEFLYIAKENSKIKAAQRRKQRKEQEANPLAAYHESEQQNMDKPINNFSEEDDYGDDYNGEGFDFGGGDDDFDDGDHNGTVGNSGLDNLEDAFGFRHTENDSTHEDGGSSFAKSFEEICRAHIEAFAKSAQKFALTTKLTDRISQWQDHLSPILEAEERKASFDIHRYSQMLLDSALETKQENKRRSMDGSNENPIENSNVVEFKDVADGCTRSDICRFFLASLVLANSGNLKIEEACQEYRFEVLSTKVDKPMETYRAPSVVTAGDS